MYVNKCTKCGAEFETKNPKRVICPACLYPDRQDIALKSYDNTIKQPEQQPNQPYQNPQYQNPQSNEDRPQGQFPQRQFPPRRPFSPQQGGYNNQGGYGGGQQGGYQRPNDGGFGGQQGGYQRPNDGGFRRPPQQGGYNNQGGYGGGQQGGYQRPNDGGFRRPPQQGGYNNQGGYGGGQQGGYQRPNDGGFRRPPQQGGFGGGYNNQGGGFRRPPQQGGFQNRGPGGFNRGGPRRPAVQKKLLISREQVAEIERLYRELLPLPNPDCHEIIGQKIELEPNKVFFGMNLVRQKMNLPKLPYPKRKLAVSPEQLIAIQSLYSPLLPLPPIGCHKFISKQLKMDEWRVHVGIGILRKQMNLPRWNMEREDAPAEFKNQAKPEAEAEEKQ